MERLLHGNANNNLSLVEQTMLLTLREEADRLMFRRSYALLLLKRRGHQISQETIAE